MGKNVGFISTRFAGTDGVTLEASKWAQVFRRLGHECFWFAGQLDRSPERSMQIPEVFFQHEQNQLINEKVLGKKARSSTVTEMIQEMKVLTIIATIFIPITFIAGIYGMNFKYMPELDWKWGYFIFWGFVVVIVLGMIGFFKRKKWI